MNSLVTHIGDWHPGLIVVLALVAGTLIGGFLKRPIRGTIIAACLIALLVMMLPGQRAGWQRAWQQDGWAARGHCLGDVLGTGALWHPSSGTWAPALAAPATRASCPGGARAAAP